MTACRALQRVRSGRLRFQAAVRRPAVARGSVCATSAAATGTHSYPRYAVGGHGAVRQLVRKSGNFDNGQPLDARVIETNMAINRGDSGSAVVNAQGEVVGVTNMGFRGTDNPGSPSRSPT